MYYVQDAHSFWDWTYFICLIIVGSYFMMNLCLVVITAQFGVTKKRETERMAAELKRYSESHSSLKEDRKISFWKRIMKYFRQLWERLCKRCAICSKNSARKSNKVSIIIRYD